jgi:hypothetical protein
VIRTIFLVALCAALFVEAACASDGYDFHAPLPNDHFVWPKRLFELDPAKFVDVTIDLHVHLDGQAPSPTQSVYYIDLNGDGVKEMIVRLGRDGHQEDMGIFQLQSGKWVDIGDFINGCFFCSKWNGYYQLEYYGNGGGEIRSRSLQRFIRGRYREVRDEILRAGSLDEERINPNGLGD